MDHRSTEDSVRYRTRMVPRVMDPSSGSDEESAIHQRERSRLEDKSRLYKTDSDVGSDRDSRVRKNSHNEGHRERHDSLNGVGVRQTIQEAETSFGGFDDDTTEDTHRLLPGSDSDDGGIDRPDAMVVDDDGGVNVNDLIQSIQSDETSLGIISQVSLPFIIAGYGTVGAGMVLDIVQHWTVFQRVGEIFILVPALLGLKGNLEMTLASRLSTQANLGNMDSKKEMIKMVGGNMALIQAQAIVVGFLSSLTAMIMGWIPKGEFDFNHALLLCASSLFTASIASMVLGKQHWLAPVIISFFLILLPLWVVICVKNKYTNEVIYSGWTPVLSAMVISSIGGLILDFAVANYHGIAVFQPVINGVGGNLVAVHASRISTTLHLKGRPGSRIQDTKLKGCLNPFKVYFGPGVHSRAARVLTLLTVPGHLMFTYTIFSMKAGHTSMSVLFNVFYLTAALLQVVILIYIATWMVPMIWVGGSDPDNVAIPYLTAIGDLLGTAFLALAFHLLFLLGDRDADVGD